MSSDSDIDKVAEELQSKVLVGYSDVVVDHAQNPRNLGSLPNADGFASITGSCGDNMEIWLNVKDGIISEVGFWTDGCGSSIVAGSMATELAKGKSLAVASRISQQDILGALGGLPEESEHCALLASNAVKEAIKNYLALKNEPWKKAYRRQT
ncbi:MAG: iron-sulfur cluster assembly scaffold protein [Chloroflexota bacterium]|nr:iron-sulfur cluster assembly scaffold protein [Chloroflexota bacterium]